jgi:hypothetical protein
LFIISYSYATIGHVIHAAELYLHPPPKDAKAGDKLLFHFSGHGSQIRDRDGDELKDQLDEIICPHDMDWNGTYIVDDDLKAVFSKLPAGG